MATFGIEIANGGKAHAFMTDTRKRLQEENWITSPFKGGIKKAIQGSTSTLYAIHITPLYPPLYWLALLPLGFCLIWPKLWMILTGVFIASSGILWTPRFYHLMLYLGIRKHAPHTTTRYYNAAATLNKIIAE